MMCCRASSVAVVAAQPPPPIPEECRTAWKGAGLIFTNDAAAGLILCGYEPGKRVPAIYGIGGKRESDDDTCYTTAFRETFEELLGIQLPRAQLGRLAGGGRRPRRVDAAHGYVMFHYTFSDLEAFLKEIRLSRAQSPFYGRFPQTVAELILTRDCKKSTEMQHLCLLPVVSPMPVVSRDLAGDVARIVAARPSK